MSRSVVKKGADVAPEKTPWFDGGVKPAHPGVYQRQYRGGINGAGPRPVVYCRWDGRRWYGFAFEPKFAAMECIASQVQDRPWRGLSKNPEAA